MEWRLKSTANPVDVTKSVGRIVILLLCFAAVPAVAAASAAKPSTWASKEIRVVTSAGLLGGGSVSAFRADDPLTAEQLEDLVFDLKQRLAPPVGEPEPDPVWPPTTTAPGTTTTLPTTTIATTTTSADTTQRAPKRVANPAKPVTITTLDARLVGALGLGKAASTFARNAKAAGLEVPSRFGTEVVARLLGLRLNHPASDDGLELLPSDPSTRAEAAYSVAQLLSFDGSEADAVQQLADAFLLPELSDWQKQILTTAVARIGMPYIWGGTSDGPETEFGVSSRGGYDCSGFVWRVYKLEPYANEGALAGTLRGRTTYQMGGEVPKSKRIPLVKLQPADVIFFGDRGPKSEPSQVGHMGIYLGNGWFIHSSVYGVAVARLDGWYSREFAWGRRPLSEAGLSP